MRTQLNNKTTPPSTHLNKKQFERVAFFALNFFLRIDS